MDFPALEAYGFEGPENPWPLLSLAGVRSSVGHGTELLPEPRGGTEPKGQAPPRNPGTAQRGGGVEEVVEAPRLGAPSWPAAPGQRRTVVAPGQQTGRMPLGKHPPTGQGVRPKHRWTKTA